MQTNLYVWRTELIKYFQHQIGVEFGVMSMSYPQLRIDEVRFCNYVRMWYVGKIWFRASRSMCERKRDFLWVFIMLHSVFCCTARCCRKCWFLYRSVAACGVVYVWRRPKDGIGAAFGRNVFLCLILPNSATGKYVEFGASSFSG